MVFIHRPTHTRSRARVCVRAWGPVWVVTKVVCVIDTCEVLWGHLKTHSRGRQPKGFLRTRDVVYSIRVNLTRIRLLYRVDCESKSGSGQDSNRVSRKLPIRGRIKTESDSTPGSKRLLNPDKRLRNSGWALVCLGESGHKCYKV